MFELMKIVGVSAVLSAGFVTASEIQPVPAPTSGKLYSDRVPQGDAVPARALRISYAAGGLTDREEPQASNGLKGDLLGKAPRNACASQAWPNVTPECLEAATGTPVRSSVRMITVEQREGANTSVLVRIPAAEVAQR
jgi:hypothetical protein